MPVVRSSSPPLRNGVGSSSSEMCTQRIWRSSPPASTRAVRPSSSSRLPTVSIGLRSWRSASGGDLLPGLLEHGAQDRADLLELLGVADERRGELDDGVAAVVGAADQPAPVQLPGEEAA